MLDLAIVRLIFILVISGCAYYFQPFHLAPVMAAAGGLVVGAAIILFEIRLEKISLKRLIGAAFGSVLGIFGAFLMSLVLLGLSRKLRHASFLASVSAAVDDLCRPDGGRQERRHAEPGRAGRHVRRRKRPPRKPSRSWTPASLSTAASPISPKPGSWTACW